MSLTFVILSAGPARQMSKWGVRSALKINGVPLIKRQVTTIRECVPGANVVVVGGYQIDKLRKVSPPNIKIVENEDFASTSTGYSALLGLREATGDIIIIYGDLVFDHKPIVDVADSGGSAVLVEPTTVIGEVGVSEVKGRVQNFEYGLPNRWLQIVRLASDDAERIKGVASSPLRKTWLLHEVFNKAVDSGVGFRVARCSGSVSEIDKTADYRRLRDCTN